MEIGICRFKLVRLDVVSLRTGKIELVAINRPAVDVKSGESGIALDGGGVCSDRLAIEPLFLIRVSEVMVCVNVVRGKTNRLGQVSDRRAVIPIRIMGIAA